MWRKSGLALLLVALVVLSAGCAASDLSGLADGSGGLDASAAAAGDETPQAEGVDSSSAYSSQAQSPDEDAGDKTNATPGAVVLVDDPVAGAVVKEGVGGATSSGSEPGLVEGSGPSITGGSNGVGENEREEPQAADVATWPVYTDQTYGFRISYPPYYLVETLDPSLYAGFAPVALAGVDFQDEDVAKSDTAALAQPAFSIRVFENKVQQPLETWLASAGLVKAGQYTEPYQGSHESGVSVLSKRYVSTGWVVYVAGEGVVFQLTPVGPTGKLMLDSFDIRN